MTDLVANAQEVFPGSEVVAEPVTFERWFRSLRSQLETILILWPEAPVTCLICQGSGCRRCDGAGKTPLGPEPFRECCDNRGCHRCIDDQNDREEQKLEVACRLLMNARYFTSCPKIQEWIDRAIDAICARWQKLFDQHKPPF